MNYLQKHPRLWWSIPIVIALIFTVKTFIFYDTTMERGEQFAYCQGNSARKATKFEFTWDGGPFYLGNYGYCVARDGNPKAGQEVFVFRQAYLLGTSLPTPGHERLRFVATNVTKEPEKDPPPIGSLIFSPRDDKGGKGELKTLLFFGVSRPLLAVRCELHYENNDTTELIQSPENPTFLIAIHNYGLYGRLITAKFYNANDELVYTYTQ